MNRLRNILIGLAVVALAVYSCVRLTFPVADISYRLTIEALTPDGPKTGSGVINASYGSQWNMNGGGRRGDVSVTGEAVYLDLGGGRNLFVTLTDDGSGRPGRPSSELDIATSAQWLPTKVFGFSWNWGNEGELAQQVWIAKQKGSKKDVPLVALPTTVTFRNLNDPKTVELVDPRDIAASFGEGYALTKATLELTDDPPTEGIEKILVWLESLAKVRARLNGRTGPVSDNELSNNLGSGEFKTGE